jgi:hypothetical protein
LVRLQFFEHVRSPGCGMKYGFRRP